MTLILTALTPRYIVQVSDRRVVGGGQQWDGHIKAVVTNRIACAYTGVADLDAGTGTPKFDNDTAYWVAMALSDLANEQDRPITELALATEQAMKSARYDGRWVSLVCAGWTPTEADPEPVAIVITAWGFDASTGSTRPAEIVWIKNRKPPSVVLPVPRWLTDKEVADLNDEVRDRCNSGGYTARALAQVLTRWVREISQSSTERQEAISEDVIVTSLPRPDLLAGNAVLGELAEDYYSVIHIPAGPDFIERHGGPLIVGEQAVLRALPPEESPPGDEPFVGAEIVRAPREGHEIVVSMTRAGVVGWGWPGAPAEPPNRDDLAQALTRLEVVKPDSQSDAVT
jgi:hypothetical protein